jgi:hypothetical protein
VKRNQIIFTIPVGREESCNLALASSTHFGFFFSEDIFCLLFRENLLDLHI